jgi:hypothetical protein
LSTGKENPKVLVGQGEKGTEHNLKGTKEQRVSGFFYAVIELADDRPKARV